MRKTIKLHRNSKFSKTITPRVLWVMVPCVYHYHPLPPTHRITDTYENIHSLVYLQSLIIENITFPRPRWRAAIITTDTLLPLFASSEASLKAMSFITLTLDSTLVQLGLIIRDNSSYFVGFFFKIYFLTIVFFWGGGLINQVVPRIERFPTNQFADLQWFFLIFFFVFLDLQRSFS